MTTSTIDIFQSHRIHYTKTSVNSSRTYIDICFFIIIIVHTSPGTGNRNVVDSFDTNTL